MDISIFSEDELSPVGFVKEPKFIPIEIRDHIVHANDEILNLIAATAFQNTIKIKKVIFNKPATIVLWSDGSKTIVKRQKGDRWDKEKGLAMCIIKKLSGNTGAYYKIFKEYCND